MDGEGGSVMGTTGNIYLGHGEATEDLTGQIHQLPCCIKHNGPCFVSHFFKPKQSGSEIEGLQVEEACFKGRKLLGRRFHFPNVILGLYWARRVVAKEKFVTIGKRMQNLTYWNHDTPPSQDDAHLCSFHWFPVAQALHKRVTTKIWLLHL